MKMFDKKSLLYLGIVFTIAVLVLFAVFYYGSQMPEQQKIVTLKKLEKEKVIQQQLQELDQLKEEAQLLTEEEIQDQLKELEQIQQGIQSLTEEEIQKQLKELNKLH